MSKPLHRRILALPVDGRPVVRAQVQQLVACAGWQLLVPDVAALGHFRQAADRDALHQWVLQQAPLVDGLVLSLDMLLYGGLVPSRFIEDSPASLLQRLALLRELKALHPQQPVYAFAATMRLSNNNVADEEKPYWAQYGQLLWQWSFHSDRAANLGQAQARAEASGLAQQAAAQIPAAIQDDYTRTRARNFALTCAALQATQDGLIDRLVLPQDDTAAWGFNIAERRQLQARVQEMNLQNKVLIYAGADEVLHTLCAHLVQHLQGTPPLRVALAASDPAHIKQLHALYEDRPLLQSLASQLQAVGAVLCTPGSPEANLLNEDTAFGQADLLLALHTQGTDQGDWAMQKPLPQRPGLHASWLPRLWAAYGRGLPVALVDLAYANGGDPWLLAQALPPLFTYAGWNTASNSLGSALAHTSLVWAAVQANTTPAGGHAAHPAWSAPASTQVLSLRLLEDGLYQAVQRQTLRGCLLEAGASAADLERLAAELVLPWANAWAAQRGMAWRVHHVALPWQRTFEIDLQLQPAL